MLEQFEEIRSKASALVGDIEGQDGLFSGVQRTEEPTDTFRQIPEYPQGELLSFEKELLGFYLTRHPMADALEEVAQFVSHKHKDFDPQTFDGQKVTVGGFIVSVRQVLTKQKQEEMCFGTLEDGTGPLEFVVFPKTYALVKELLKQDTIVILKGTLQLREEKLCLQVEKAREPKVVIPQELPTAGFILTIPRGTPKERLQQVGTYLKSRPGSDQLSVIIPNGSSQTVMKLPYLVSWDQDTQTHVNTLLAQPLPLTKE
jgi:DNA polymerase-3 subunit alpha